MTINKIYKNYLRGLISEKDMLRQIADVDKNAIEDILFIIHKSNKEDEWSKKYERTQL